MSTSVAVGSLWMTNDRRFTPQLKWKARFKVVAIVGAHAKVENVEGPARPRRINLSRFRANSTGYVPAKEP